MARKVASKEAAQKMVDAYHFFKQLPGIRELVEGREQKIGLIEFEYGDYVFYMGWLKGVGMAWTYWERDVSCELPIEGVKPRGAHDYVISLDKLTNIMAITKILAERRHPVAQDIIRKKLKKALAWVKTLRFRRDGLPAVFTEGVWNIYPRLSNSKVLVFSTIDNVIFACVSLGVSFYVCYGRTHKPTLFDIYYIIANNGLNAFDIVADTPEKKNELLMQMLAKEGR